ncbi:MULTISPECIES: hypothetical protein [unclassified Herbaspirillum]|uniref:hypothetical protein n=1 Tax=unclassified Herbaspirillum TaxID=2624150 RepID=UPI00114E3874|nr:MULTISPECIES: hypothetical protein [unclassified Herbaspirillum]MBB5391031.1 hypothetical protein [Herbaspirillum sp. SJZ102]
MNGTLLRWQWIILGAASDAAAHNSDVQAFPFAVWPLLTQMRRVFPFVVCLNRMSPAWVSRRDKGCVVAGGQSIRNARIGFRRNMENKTGTWRSLSPRRVVLRIG